MPNGLAIAGYILGSALMLWGAKAFCEPLDKIWRGTMRIRLRWPITSTKQQQDKASTPDTALNSLGTNFQLPHIEFYENREELKRIRRGLENELKTVEEAWVLTFTGDYPTTHELFGLHRIKKLLLLHPKGQQITKTAPAFNRTPSEMAGSIRTTTRNAQQSGGVEIRWFDGPITGMTIGDPDLDKAWIRVEVPFAYWRDRAGFLVKKAEYPTLFTALKKTFLEQWEHGTRPPSLLVSDKAEPPSQ